MEDIMGNLEQKVSVITGGASGIGAATVRLFAKEGSKVVVADILDEKGEALAAELGPGVTYVHTDVRNESEIAQTINHAFDKFGRLDCLFNNAGIGGISGSISEITSKCADLLETIDTSPDPAGSKSTSGTSGVFALRPILLPSSSEYIMVPDLALISLFTKTNIPERP